MLSICFAGVCSTKRIIYHVLPTTQTQKPKTDEEYVYESVSFSFTETLIGAQAINCSNYC